MTGCSVSSMVHPWYSLGAADEAVHHSIVANNQPIVSSTLQTGVTVGCRSTKLLPVCPTGLCVRCRLALELT